MIRISELLHVEKETLAIIDCESLIYLCIFSFMGKCKLTAKINVEESKEAWGVENIEGSIGLSTESI